MTSPPESGPVAIRAAFGPLRETIETLWTGLVPAGPFKVPLRVAFSSSAHGDGTTTVAACAAIGLALHRREKVVLIEANGYTPGLARHLGLPPGPGLSEVLRGERALEAALRETDVPGLVVAPWGTPDVHDRGLGASETTRAILERLTAEGRHVLVDMPPILAHPAELSLAWTMESAVIVFRAGRTSAEDAAAMVKAVNTAGIHLLGAILNRHRRDLPRWMGGLSRRTRA